MSRSQEEGQDYHQMLNSIVDAVASNPELKPLQRSAVRPEYDSPLHFEGQEELTRPLVQAYLDRAIVHMREWNARTRRFYRDSGAKFVHWSDYCWNNILEPSDWRRLAGEIDAIHSTPWGCDMVFVAGVMEAVSRTRTSRQRIPDWLLTILEKEGIQELRQPGPNGLEYFNYEAMIDRHAEDWPDDWVGLWVSREDEEQGPPDITLLETQIYYAWLIAEFLDAGFEGIMFGQVLMTGYRDEDNNDLHALCEFATRWAEARGYRRAVMLTSHVIEPPFYPREGPDAKPLFTHLSWPTRMSYTDQQPFGMHFGPEAKATEKRHGGEEIILLLEKSRDLPVLLEIDNYGKGFGPSKVAGEGWDEITAFAKKPAEDRRSFLKHYYFESRRWLNEQGHSRIHIALPGGRRIHEPASLDVDAEGRPLEPVEKYLPYRELGGDEDTIAMLFDHARDQEDFALPGYAFDSFNYTLGTQTFAPQYTFTEKTELVETAGAIWNMGSNIIKFDLSPEIFGVRYHLPRQESINSLRQVVRREPSVRHVLEMPFAHYLLWAYPHSIPGSQYHHWRDGLSEEEAEKDYREMYDLTASLLEDFSGTHKRFYLGHWEGDWALLGSFNPEDTPAPEAIQGMIDWLNVRQKAVEDAKRDTPHEDVEVYHYTEVNLVRKAMQGKPAVTNDVLPHVDVDYVSYSCYDSLYDPKAYIKGFPAMSRVLKESLDYIQQNLPSKDMPGRRVFIGEYGFPLERVDYPIQQNRASRTVVRTALEWGCPFALYWQLYCNEPAPDGGLRGFWMIDSEGVKQPVYKTHKKFLRMCRDYVRDVRLQKGKTPGREEFLEKGIQFLQQ